MYESKVQTLKSTAQWTTAPKVSLNLKKDKPTSAMQSTAKKTSTKASTLPKKVMEESDDDVVMIP